MKKLYGVFSTVFIAGLTGIAFAGRPIDTLRRSDMEFLTSSEASRIGEQVLAYQRITGGWPKNVDMCPRLCPLLRTALVLLAGKHPDSKLSDAASRS